MTSGQATEMEATTTAHTGDPRNQLVAPLISLTPSLGKTQTTLDSAQALSTPEQHSFLLTSIASAA